VIAGKRSDLDKISNERYAENKGGKRGQSERKEIENNAVLGPHVED